MHRAQEGACAKCKALNGKIYTSFKEVFEHPNCRCYLEPIEEATSDLSNQVERFIGEFEQDKRLRENRKKAFENMSIEDISSRMFLGFTSDVTK